MTDLADAPVVSAAADVQAPDDEAPNDHIAVLADTLIDLVRTVNRGRQRWLAAAAHDAEWSANAVLRTLDTDGPQRASALADALQFDPSTVSRQVAALIKDGLVERRADPDDGRASLLVLTQKAGATLADHRRARAARFADMLADWSDDDVADFTDLLTRFTTAYERTIAERTAPAAPRPERDH